MKEKDTGQISSNSNKARDQTSSHTNSEDTRLYMDERMPDYAQTMNRRSRKSAEEEYDEIQKEARENPQEPRCLRSHSRNN